MEVVVVQGRIQHGYESWKNKNFDSLINHKEVKKYTMIPHRNKQIPLRCKDSVLHYIQIKKRNEKKKTPHDVAASKPHNL